MRSKTFYAVIVVFFLGIIFQVFFPLGVYFGIFLFVLAGVLFLFSLASSSRKSRFVFLVSVCFIAFGVGVIRMGLLSETPSEAISSHVPEEVTIQAVVLSEPDQRAKNTQLRVSIESIRFVKEDEREKKFIDVSQHEVKVLLFASRYKNFQYGEKILAKGVLERPENFQTGNGRTFDYVHYLEKDDTRYIMFYPEVKHLSYGHGFFLKEKLFDIKHVFLSSLERIIPEPQSSLLGGLLVGAKQSLGDEWLEKFRTAGVIHIVVLSGYNVTLVAYFIMGFFSRMRVKPKTAAIFSGVGILLFMILVGAGATVIRASFMALLVIFARTTGRTSDMVRFLFLVGAGMVLWNPMILLYSPSFQLSFLATLGLLLFSPVVYQWLPFIPEKFLLREITSATIATQVFVLPMILHIAGFISLVAVPVNLLVLTVIPFTMFFGFVAGVIGLFSAFLALPFAYAAHFLLSYILMVVDIASGFAFAKIVVPPFSFWFVLLAYVLYGVLLFRYRYLLSGSYEQTGLIQKKGED